MLVIHEVNFECEFCRTWTVVETGGQVVVGPKCRVCKTEMREVHTEQGHLDLFDNGEQPGRDMGHDSSSNHNWR